MKRVKSGRKAILGVIVLSLCFAAMPSTAHAVTYGSTIADPTVSAPWVVSIWNSQTNDVKDADFICSGTLISPHTVLTAAHCTLEPGAYFVKVKSQALRDQTALTTVSGVWTSPRYDPKNFTNDIGLLKLDDEFPGIVYPSLANAQAAKSINSKSIFTLYGWGRDQSGNLADLLRSAKLSLQDSLAAKSFKSAFNPKTMISAGRRIVSENVWSGACPGDSGGPLIISINQINVIAGVTSFGEKSCLTPNPTVFSRVSYYVSDIQSGLKSVELKSTVVNRTAPIATTEPQIIGNLVSNGSLTCEPGMWKNSVSTSISWTSPKRLIGTTIPTVRVQTSDAGQVFACSVIVSTKSGTIVRKNLKKQAANAPLLMAVPAISGVDLSAPVVAGSTLRCDGWNWDGPVDSESIQWFLTSQANPSTPVNGLMVGSGRTLSLDASLIGQLKGRFVTCDVTGVRNGFSVDAISAIKLNPLDGPTISSVNVSGSSLSLGSALTCLFSVSQSATKIEISWGTSSDGISFAPFPGVNGNVLQINRSVLQQGAGKVVACQVRATNTAGQAQRVGVASGPFPNLPTTPVVSISNSGNISANSYIGCSAQAGSGYFGQLTYQWGATSGANSTNFIGAAFGNSATLTMNSTILSQVAGNFLTCTATATNDAGSTIGSSSIFVSASVLPLPTPSTPVVFSEKADTNSVTEVISIPYFAGFDSTKMNLVMSLSSPTGSCTSAINVYSLPALITCNGLSLSTRYTASLVLSYQTSGGSTSTYSQQLVFATGKSSIPTTPPTVLNYSQSYTGSPAISPASATAASLASSGLEIRFVVQDAFVPVASAKAQLLASNGQVVASGNATFLGGNSQDGAWKATLTIPSSTSAGTYSVQAAASDGFNTSAWVGLGNLTITAGNALIPTFGVVSSSANGFSVQVLNYDSNYSWTTSVSYGNSTINSSGLVTVSSLNAGATAALVVSTSRTGFNPGSASITGSTSTQPLPVFAAPVVSSVTTNSVVVTQPALPSGWNSNWQIIAQVYSNDQVTLVGASSSGSYYSPGASLSVVANNVGGISPDTNYQVRFAVYDNSLSRYSYGTFSQFRTTPVPASISNLGVIPGLSTIGIKYTNQIVLNAPTIGNISGYSATFTWYVKTVTASGTFVSNIPANTGNQIYITGLTAGTTYNIYLTATDSAGSTKSSVALSTSTQAAVDTQAPTIDSVAATLTPTSLYENGSITVSVPIADNVGVVTVSARIGQLSFNLSRTSGTALSGIWSGTSGMNFAGGSSDGYLQPGIYSPTIIASDLAGNSTSSTLNASFILGSQSGGATIANASASAVSGNLYPGGSIQINANIIAYNQTISAVRYNSDGYNLTKFGLLTEVSGNSYNKNFSATFSVAANQAPGTYVINLVAETANGRSSTTYTLNVTILPTPAPVSQASVTESYFTGSVQQRCPDCTTVRAGFTAVYWEIWTLNATSLSVTATNGTDTLTSPEPAHGGNIQQAFDYGNGLKKWYGYIQLWPGAPIGTYVATWIVTDGGGLIARYPAGTFTIIAL